jgi:hypothetical protein
MARAAGIFRWTGAVDTVFSKGTNWINELDVAWDINQYPSYDNALTGNVDGDTVLFDAAVTNSPAGVDISAKGDLQSFKVTADYNGTIGSLAVPLIFDMTATGECIITGTIAGDMHLKGGGTNGLKTVTTMDSKSGSTINLDGSIGTIQAIKATINVLASATIVTALNIQYKTNKASDVIMTLNAGVTLPPTIRMLGGIVTNSNAVASLSPWAGTWKQLAGNITSLTNYGGRVEWYAGNITTSNIYAGTVDGSMSTDIRTMTNCYLYRDGSLNVNNGVDTITVINLYMYSENPKLTICPGQKVAI